MDLLTVEETAAMLRVSPETIRLWLRKGELTGADTPAGWRIARADIEAWLAKYRREPVAQADLKPFTADLKPFTADLKPFTADLKPWAPNPAGSQKG